jgi:hypothetical protein
MSGCVCKYLWEIKCSIVYEKFINSNVYLINNLLFMSLPYLLETALDGTKIDTFSYTTLCYLSLAIGT